jgi:sugar (pentulose or hexulose) kinase
MIADALGRPLLLAREGQASSRGAALLAAAAVGAVGDLAAAARTDTDRIPPEPGRTERFRELAARQRRLYAALYGEPGGPPLHSPRLPL